MRNFMLFLSAWIFSCTACDGPRQPVVAPPLDYATIKKEGIDALPEDLAVVYPIVKYSYDVKQPSFGLIDEHGTAVWATAAVEFRNSSYRRGGSFTR